LFLVFLPWTWIIKGSSILIFFHDGWRHCQGFFSNQNCIKNNKSCFTKSYFCSKIQTIFGNVSKVIWFEFCYTNNFVRKFRKSIKTENVPFRIMISFLPSFVKHISLLAKDSLRWLLYCYQKYLLFELVFWWSESKIFSFSFSEFEFDTSKKASWFFLNLSPTGF